MSTNPNARRILVACYSLSGNTRRLAMELARACDADVEIISDTAHRTGFFGGLRSALQALLHWHPTIGPSRCVPRDYELVVVCTPVWAWNMAAPMRTWLRRHRAGIRRVACVCTYGSSGQVKVLDDLARLCGRPAVATLAMPAERIEQKSHGRRLQDFASRVSLAAGFQRPAQQDAA